MKLIASRENTYFKLLKKLAASAKERRETSTAMLDGEHLLSAYLDSGGVPQAVIVSSSARGQPAIENLLQRAATAESVELPDTLFAEVAPVKSPTGIMALIAIPEPVPQAADFCVLLEDIQDPGNLGSILRSAAAAGAQAAYLSQHCTDPWSPKVLRAGMGAHFSLQIFESADLPEIAQTFTGSVVAATLVAERSLYQLDLSGSVTFAIGNEGAGLSEKLLAAVDVRVTIPMPGAMESLNAAAAAAICLFERVRQKQQAL
jgi:TrmH family RNA methyltransferase